jgi:hypothetical protein
MLVTKIALCVKMGSINILHIETHLVQILILIVLIVRRKFIT